MAKSLIIVESPTKAKTITKYLGRGYTVMASVGHIKDLPTSKLGVDLEHDFKPQYVTIKGKSKVLADIKKKAEESDKVFLAPDPDREGEAIAWHLAEELRGKSKARKIDGKVFRVLFNEITERPSSGTAVAWPDRHEAGQCPAGSAGLGSDRRVPR